MNEYVISADQAADRKLEFTWTPNPFPGAPNTLWVEYPFEVAQIKGQDVFYPVLPVFQALGFADSRFHLVSPSLSRSGARDGESAFEQVLANWLDIVEKEAVDNFGKPIRIEADIEGRSVDRRTVARVHQRTPHPGVALFLGGGAESLLTLAELIEQETKPHLISYLGPGWIGNDPARNDTKIAQDLRVAQELDLPLHHVRTNIYGLFAQMQNDLEKRMVVDAFFVNRVPFTPILVSLFAPMTGVYRLGAVYHGHEKHYEPDITFHCFTKTFTDQLAASFSPAFAYQRLLANLHKVDVFEKLCTKHREFLTYQYSCFNNEHERWCLSCEKCFRYFILFKLYDVPFSAVGFDEARMLRNFSRVEEEIIRHVWSDDCSRASYRATLAKARARGSKEVYDLLARVIRQAQRFERAKKAKAIIRPFVPQPVRQLVKNALQSLPRRAAHAKE